MKKYIDYSDMTKEEIEHFLLVECEEQPEMSFDEYREAIAIYLILCSYHYSPESAIEFIERFETLIRREYDKNETVGEVAISYGYCCG